LCRTYLMPADYVHVLIIYYYNHLKMVMLQCCLPVQLHVCKDCRSALKSTSACIVPGKMLNLAFGKSSPPLMYFPERAPPARGEYAIKPTLHCLGAQNSARSVSNCTRDSRLYTFCMLAMRGRPDCSAACMKRITP